MTFEDAYCVAIEELDTAWRVVREIHTDRKHLNDASGAYTAALSELQNASQKVFRIKTLMAEYEP